MNPKCYARMIANHCVVQFDAAVEKGKKLLSVIAIAALAVVFAIQAGKEPRVKEYGTVWK